MSVWIVTITPLCADGSREQVDGEEAVYVEAGNILEIFIFNCAVYLNVLLKSL